MIEINHVMSNKSESRIFNDFLNYFRKHSSDGFTCSASVCADNAAAIRHYHRPHLEKKLLNPCLVTVHHDLRDSDRASTFENFEDQYRQADMVVCLNHGQRQFLADRGINHTAVIPHGYNDTFLRPVKRDYTAGRRITLGVISKRYGRKVKGEAYIYELAKLLDSNHFGFMLVGDGRWMDARHLRQRGFEAVSYEFLPYAVLCDVYRHIDILLIASHFEGGPASIPEAVATATPIFSSPVGMATDLVEDKLNGHILSMEPAQDAEIFNALITDKGAALKSMFRQAALRVKTVRPWAETVAKYEALYESILQQNQNQPLFQHL